MSNSPEWNIFDTINILLKINNNDAVKLFESVKLSDDNLKEVIISSDNNMLIGLSKNKSLSPISQKILLLKCKSIGLKDAEFNIITTCTSDLVQGTIAHHGINRYKELLASNPYILPKYQKVLANNFNHNIHTALSLNNSIYSYIQYLLAKSPYINVRLNIAMMGSLLDRDVIDLLKRDGCREVRNAIKYI